MFGLNIYLHSIKFYNEILDDDAKIKVCIATVPDKNKQSLIIDSKELNNINNSFKINISEHIKEILFVFWRENKLQNDKIIASTIIHVSQLPHNIKDNKSQELKNINIYEPMHFMSSDNNTIYGSMKIKLALSQPFIRENENKIKKILLNNQNINHNTFLLYESVLI